MTFNSGSNSIESVSGSVIDEGLELSCAFANGSQTQSCILTVCRLKNSTTDKELCINVTIPRDSQSHMSSKRLTNLHLGQYVISLVGQINCDGGVTVLRTTSVSITLIITGTVATYTGVLYSIM